MIHIHREYQTRSSYHCTDDCVGKLSTLLANRSHKNSLEWPSAENSRSTDYQNPSDLIFNLCLDPDSSFNFSGDTPETPVQKLLTTNRMVIFANFPGDTPETPVQKLLATNRMVIFANFLGDTPETPVQKLLTTNRMVIFANFPGDTPETPVQKLLTTNRMVIFANFSKTQSYFGFLSFWHLGQLGVPPHRGYLGYPPPSRGFTGVSPVLEEALNGIQQVKVWVQP
jgi:hypothetical protein